MFNRSDYGMNGMKISMPVQITSNKRNWKKEKMHAVETMCRSGIKKGMF
jgi:hypothetical protein